MNFGPIVKSVKGTAICQFFPLVSAHTEERKGVVMESSLRPE